MSFLMIPLTTLYDEYIDRSKVSEQKNPVEYVVPPPSREWGKIIRKRQGQSIMRNKIVEEKSHYLSYLFSRCKSNKNSFF